jgi:vacuolar protein sorting-associated protein 13A/C
LTDLQGSDHVVLVTTSRILSFRSKKLRLEWELLFAQLSGVINEDTGVKFSHKGGQAHDRFVYIGDKVAQQWFFEQVAGVVSTFNAQRRIDG